MSRASRYAATGLAVVVLGVLAMWPFLDPAGRRGVLIAAGVAVPVQAVAFAALLRFRGELNGFLAAWVGGTLLRMVILGVVAVLAIRTQTEGAVPMLLALAAFFFGLLLLEPMFFGPDTNEATK